MKKCKKCGNGKELDNFHKDISRKDGLHPYCSECISKQGKEYHNNNKELVRKRKKEYCERNKDNLKIKRAKWYLLNREKVIESVRKYRKNNPDKILKRHRDYYYKNRESVLKQMSEHNKKNSKEINKRYRVWINNNPQARLRHSITSGIWKLLKKRSSNKDNKSIFEFLPYSLKQLMQRLEVNFQSGMSWNNYGKWHVDHKKPDCLFNYKSINDSSFRDCWSLANLQPLWANDNLKKNKKFKV